MAVGVRGAGGGRASEPAQQGSALETAPSGQWQTRVLEGQALYALCAELQSVRVSFNHRSVSPVEVLCPGLRQGPQPPSDFTVTSFILGTPLPW